MRVYREVERSRRNGSTIYPNPLRFKDFDKKDPVYNFLVSTKTEVLERIESERRGGKLDSHPIRGLESQLDTIEEFINCFENNIKSSRVDMSLENVKNLYEKTQGSIASFLEIIPRKNYEEINWNNVN